MYAVNMYLMQILTAAQGGAKKNKYTEKEWHEYKSKQKTTINVCSRKGLNRESRHGHVRREK